MFETETLTFGPMSLAVHRWSASPSRGTVLLLHGFMDVGTNWDLVAPTLARAGFTVVAPDLRGFGASGRLPLGSTYYFPDYLVDLEGLVATLGEGPLSIVGHSMGGTIAALYAAAFPARVTRLVLMEGVGPVDDRPEHAPLRLRKWLDDASSVRAPLPMSGVEDAARRLQKSHPRLDLELLISRAKNLTQETPSGLVWAWDPSHRKTSPIPFRSDAFEAFLRAIACPTLWIGGGTWGFHPPDEEARLTQIPKLERWTLEEAGHMMHWSHPDAVAARITAFLGA